jgi:hypothetical protein
MDVLYKDMSNRRQQQYAYTGKVSYLNQHGLALRDGHAHAEEASQLIEHNIG